VSVIFPIKDASQPLLRPGLNCWRTAHAQRIAMLVDGATYFDAMRMAIQKAQRSILLLGWDFDPRVPLEPDRRGTAEPDRLCDILGRLLAERPHLHVHILIWDMPWAFAIQRRDQPQRAGQWLSADRLSYRVDGEHPRGAAHHQKILVVDDSIAFCGGSDFTRNRWDTQQHLPVDQRRRTADGRLFGPRHDVEIAVDGAAAAIDFYKRAFGAEERYRIPAPEGKIGHCELFIGNSLVYLADEFESENFFAPKTPGRAGVYFMLEVDDADAAFEQALGAGATVARPLRNEPFGRTGDVLDPFGHRWSVLKVNPDFKPEDMM